MFLAHIVVGKEGLVDNWNDSAGCGVDFGLLVY
jgi:hypothetical protein